MPPSVGLGLGPGPRPEVARADFSQERILELAYLDYVGDAGRTRAAAPVPAPDSHVEAP